MKFLITVGICLLTLIASAQTDLILFVNDNSTVGDTLTSAIGNNTNIGTAAAPLATISEALNRILTGGTIFIDAGNYTEQVTILKEVSIKGAGAHKTIIIGPAGNLEPPPGTFTGKAIIQTSANLGFISITKLTITGSASNEDYGVLFQCPGRIDSCVLRQLKNGTYFRYLAEAYQSGSVRHNVIEEISMVGATFEGPNLRGSATANDFNLAGAAFGIAVKAGLDFGPITNFTCFNNNILHANGWGIQVNALAGNLGANNFLMANGAKAIQSLHGNTLPASCNWYNTIHQDSIDALIEGKLTYTPFFTNSGDISEAPGFQAQGFCNGYRKFYVNDSATTGDVFTTAVGSNNNPGSKSAPFFSIDHANNKTLHGDTIFVDAGQYRLQAQTLQLNKTRVLLGANYQIPPSDPMNRLLLNNARNAESIIKGGTFDITANSVRILGFRFDTENKPVVNSATTSLNFTFENNYIYRNNTIADIPSIRFTGLPDTATGPLNTRFLTNRFEANDTLSATQLILGGFDIMNVYDNIFIPHPDKHYKVSAIKVIDENLRMGKNLTIRNCRIFGGATALNIRNASQITIEGNNIANNLGGINIFTGNGNMGQISIIANVVNRVFDPAVPYSAGIELNTDPSTTGGFTHAVIRSNQVQQYVEALQGNTHQLFINARLGLHNTGKLDIFFNSLNVVSHFNSTYSVYPNLTNGILLAGRHSNTSVTYNDIKADHIIPSPVQGPHPPVPLGIYLQTDAGELGGIDANAKILIANNKFDGFKIPVGFYDPIDTGSQYTKSKGFGFLTGGATVNINHNHLNRDSISIHNGDSSQVVNGNCNDYGTIVESNITERITGKTVRYKPFLTTGEGIYSGFQGFYPPTTACASLNSFLPTEAAIGQVIILKGYGLTGVSTVKFNGVTATNFSVTNDTTIVVTVPVGANTGTIQIIKGDISVISPNNFIIIAPLVADTVGVCPGGNGVLLSNINGSSYQWQYLTNNGYTNISNGQNFSGANDYSLRLLNIPSQWDGRQFRCQVNGSVLSKNLILRAANYFTGNAGNTDWHNPMNWGCSGQVPDENTHVIISSSVTLTADAVVKSITVLPGNSFNVAQGVRLTIKP